MDYHAMVKEEFKKKREKRNLMQKITPFLWFDDEAEEAAKFYTSIFKNSKIGKITRMERRDLRFMEGSRELL